MNDLIKYSNDLKKEANEVIKNTDIVNFFSTLGKIIFVGSYALNLLYRHDIDLFILNKDCTKKKADNITKKLINNLKFQTVDHSDWKGRGYYWKLEYIYKKNKWKFDVWYTSEEKIITIEKTKKILAKLQQKPEAREQILKIKQDLYDGNTYKNNMNGFKIFEQVLGKID